MRSYYHRIRHHIRKPVHKAIKQKSSPHSIAIGFAIGTFIAIFPTFGLGFIIVLLIMLFYKTMNKIAAIAGVTFWNLVMMVPVYFASYNLGRFIFGSNAGHTLRAESHDFLALFKVKPFNFESIINFLKENMIFLKEYFVGNLIIAIFFSVLSYLLVRRAVVVYIKAKEKKLKLKRDKIKKNDKIELI